MAVRNHTGRKGRNPPRRKPNPPKTSKLHTGVDALREVQERLEAALSVTSLCVIALKAQAADHDLDIALRLECCVERVISFAMERIDNVLKGAAL